MATLVRVALRQNEWRAGRVGEVGVGDLDLHVPKGQPCGSLLQTNFMSFQSDPQVQKSVLTDVKSKVGPPAT